MLRAPRRPWPDGLPSRVAPRPGGGSRTSRSMADRKAASVLPEPVGAMTSAFSPRSMAAQARSWTGVGPSGKTEPNQARVAGAKASGSPGAAIGSAVMRPVWREPRHESRDATAPAGSTSRGTGAPSRPPPRRRSSEPRLAATGALRRHRSRNRGAEVRPMGRVGPCPGSTCPSGRNARPDRPRRRRPVPQSTGMTSTKRRSSPVRAAGIRASRVASRAPERAARSTRWKSVI